MNAIQKIYLINFLIGMVFWYGIEKVFMQSIGIGAFGVSLIATELLIITLLFDIPSGILADKWSRKNTLLLGLLCLFVSTLIYGLSTNIWHYAIGTIPYGFYLVLLSGTFGALTYDTLKESGEEALYSKVQGLGYGLFCTGMFVSSFTSGAIASHTSLKTPYLLSLAAVALAFIVLSLLKEPSFHKPTEPITAFGHFKVSLGLFTKDSTLLSILMLAIIISIINSVQTEYGSLYYIGLGLSLSVIGYANGLQNLARALGQIYAHTIGKKAFLFLPAISLCLGIVSYQPQPLSVGILIVAVFLVGSMQNQLEVSIQDAAPSHIRSTVGSLSNFLSNIILIPFGLLFGWVAMQYDIFQAFQLVFLVSLVGCIVMLGARKKIAQILSF